MVMDISSSFWLRLCLPPGVLGDVQTNIAPDLNGAGGTIYDEIAKRNVILGLSETFVKLSILSTKLPKMQLWGVQ